MVAVDLPEQHVDGGVAPTRLDGVARIGLGPQQVGRAALEPHADATADELIGPVDRRGLLAAVVACAAAVPVTGLARRRLTRGLALRTAAGRRSNDAVRRASAAASTRLLSSSTSARARPPRR